MATNGGCGGINREIRLIVTRMYHEHHAPYKAKRLTVMCGAADLLGARGGDGGIESAIGALPHKIPKLHAVETAAEKRFIVHEA